MIIALLLACQTPIFPPMTQSLRFVQSEGDRKAEMTWRDRRVDYTAEVTSQTRGKLPIVRGSLWIAKDVGLVKQFDDDPQEVFGGKTTLELLSRLPESSPPFR